MSCVSRAKQIGRGVVTAGALTALAPTTAYAKDPRVGAAIGLGILGGAIAGTPIASPVPPAYAIAPAPAFYYPPPGYYSPASVDYPAQPYYTDLRRFPDTSVGSISST